MFSQSSCVRTMPERVHGLLFLCFPGSEAVRCLSRRARAAYESSWPRSDNHASQIEVCFHFTTTGGIEAVGSREWATNRANQTIENRANGTGAVNTLSG